MRSKIIFTNKCNNSEISLADGFEDFIRAKRTKNFAIDTIRNYADCFKYFCSVVVEDNLCSSISVEDFYVFIEALKTRNENISDKTVETYMRHLRAIFTSLWNVSRLRCRNIPSMFVNDMLQSGAKKVLQNRFRTLQFERTHTSSFVLLYS